MFALALAAALLAGAPTGEQTMQHATGTFDVTITPVQPSAGAGPGAPGRMVLAKIFRGGIEGSGAGEMLATMAADQSGAYVALERVTGSVDGRAGSFAIVHRGVMEQGAQELSITVVPGSGTEKLAGITGVFHLKIEGGEHRYDLEYSLPAD